MVKKMRKLIVFFIAALFVMFFSIEAKSHDCPTGYSCPKVVQVDLCPDFGCFVDVEWCCFDGWGPTTNPIIYINSINFVNDPSTCPCLVWVGTLPPSSGHPVINMSKILDKILMSGQCCAAQALLNIPNCESGQTLQIAVTNGGCYQYIESYEYWGYRLCGDPNDLTECKRFFKVCKKLVNGVWTLEIEPDGTTNPAFSCEPGCYPICEFTD